ncbi:MAG: DNA helicase RecG, partial [Geobacter sp.]|nr:DNA helicase RecG [Geobacter sp.]
MTIIRRASDGSITIPAELAGRLLASAVELAAEVDVVGRLILTPLATRPAPESTDLSDAIKQKNLATGIQHIKGVGPKLVEAFQRLGITTLEDALYLLP